MSVQNGEPQPGSPEAIYIDTTKQAVKAAGTNSATLKAKFNEVEQIASETKRVLDGRIEKAHNTNDPIHILLPLEGVIGNIGTEKHNAKTVEIYVKEALTFYKDPTKQNLIPQGLPPTSATTLKNMCEKIQSIDVIDSKSAPYLYSFLHKLINGNIKSTGELQNAYNEIVPALTAYNDQTLIKNLRDACIQTATLEGTTLDDALAAFQDLSSAAQRTNSSVTAAERQTYEALRERINAKLNERNLSGNPLNPAEAALLQRFMNLNQDVSGPELDAVFAKLGFVPDEYKPYHELARKIFSPQNPEAIKGMASRADLLRYLADSTKKFTIDNLMTTKVIETLPDGKCHLNRKEFKRIINRQYYLALADIHTNSSADWSKVFNPYQHGYYFQAVEGLVRDLCNDMKGTLTFDEDLSSFFTDTKGRYQGSILNYAEIFHNLPLYARDVSSFEKWGQFLGYLFPSELAEVFDPEDKTMEIARRTISMHLRKRIAENGNKIPPDLFSGYYNEKGAVYELADRAKLKALLKTRVEVSSGRAPEDWELERALTYSLGIGISNLMDPEIICTADPNDSNAFMGIYPLASVLSAKHNWGMGRGYPASSIYPELLAMDVVLYPEERSLWNKLTHKKEWVPEQLHKDVEFKQGFYEDGIYDHFLDRDHKYQELLNMINIGASINSRHGWRVSPLRGLVSGYLKEGMYGNKIDNAKAAQSADGWRNNEWRQYMELCTRLYGASSMWWAVGDRVGADLKRVLSQRGGYDFMEKEYEEYTVGKEALKKEFYFDAQGKLEMGHGHKGDGYSFSEVRQMRDNAVRGETFMVYLKRNPSDFIMLLSQLSPQLIKDDVNYFQDEASLSASLSAAGKYGKDIEVALDIRNILLHRWGPEGLATMGKVREWLVRVSQIEKMGAEGKKEKLGIKGAIEYISNHSAEAFERMMNAGEKDEFGADGKLKKLGTGRRNELIAEDFVCTNKDPLTNDQLRDLFMGDGGLMKIFNMNEDFGGFNDGSEFHRGEAGFFTHMGSLWTMKEGMINPYASDLNHFATYQHLGKVGEDITKRLLSDAQGIKKMLENVGQLDHLLHNAALDKDFSKIYELHANVYSTLKGIISKEAGQKANYILAQIVAKFFHEHSDLRQIPGVPFPIRLLQRALLGNKVSLARVLTENNDALSMDSNGVRDYFRKLAHQYEVLPTEGLWSADQLEEVFDADVTSMMVGETGPNFLYFLTLFLLWTYAKKALEESSGKKGR